MARTKADAVATKSVKPKKPVGKAAVRGASKPTQGNKRHAMHEHKEKRFISDSHIKRTLRSISVEPIMCSKRLCTYMRALARLVGYTLATNSLAAAVYSKPTNCNKQGQYITTIMPAHVREGVKSIGQGILLGPMPSLKRSRSKGAEKPRKVQSAP